MKELSRKRRANRGKVRRSDRQKAILQEDRKRRQEDTGKEANQIAY